MRLCFYAFVLTVRLAIQLALYDVVLFIDDSGSMLEGSKWRDLQAIAQQIVEMTTQFDTDGIQVIYGFILFHRNIILRDFFASLLRPSWSVFPSHQLRFGQVEFMNSSVRADNVSSSADLEQIFSHVRPMGFTPLASALESKVLEPYYEMLRSTPTANVKPMVIYICTDGAPTTERGLKTYQPTFAMLSKVACFCFVAPAMPNNFVVRWIPHCRASVCPVRRSAST
jgi:hypothetical protein